MNISPSGVVMGASPPSAVAGSSRCMPASRSDTCWRAQYTSVPSAKSTVTSLMPYLETERTMVLCGRPSSSCSTGVETRCSTSSGVMPGTLRITLTWVGEISGKASMGRWT